jgi:hypothetical protein
MSTLINDKQQPATFEVCDMLDLDVLQDITEPYEHLQACPSRDDSPDTGIFFECTCPVVRMIALGLQSEPGAGIRGGAATPWFDSYEKLEAFCKRSLPRLRLIAVEQQESGEYEWVDMTNWR